MGFQSWVVHEKGVCKLEDEGIKVSRDGKAYLKVVFEKPLGNVDPKSSIAVDINTAEVIVGKDDEHYVRIPTRLEDVHHWKSLA